MRISKWVVPALVVVTLLGGYFLRLAFTQPTTAVVLTDGTGAKLQCTVQGVKCKGTAGFFTTLYQETPGIHGIETFATEHRVIFTYDPQKISPEEIRGIMEQTIEFTDGTSAQVFTCLSMDAL